MKRIVVRLAVLSGVIGLGLIGIVQAQKMFTSSAEKEPAPLPEAPAEAAPRPIPLVAEDEPVSPARDPFAGANPVRRTAAHAEVEPAPGDRYGTRHETSRYGSDRYGSSATDEQPIDPVSPARQALAEPPAEVEAAPPSGYRLQNEPAPTRDPFGARPIAAAQPAQPVAPSAADPVPALPQDSIPNADQAPPATTAAGEPQVLPGAAIVVPQPPATNNLDNFAPPANANRTAQASVELGAGPPATTDENFVPVAAAASANDLEGTGRPGAQQLEGVQAPHVTIEKRAPAEIQVGKPATFVIRVKNTGAVIAHGVEIHDQVPKGTRLVNTTPQARVSPEGALVFDIGALKPGEETTAQVQLMPLSEGEIGSLATVHFKAEASVRTLATKPELRVEVSAPPKVMIGAEVPLKIKITNPGSGAATGVVLTEKVPQGLKHSAGDELEFEVGVLKPGETRELELSLTAANPGVVLNTLTARGDANLKAENQVEVEVIAPALKVGMTGPKRRYLERSATYSISVSNPGTAPAKDIELVSSLPKGLKFVEANNAGQYDAATHSVYWSLEELPAQETGTVTLTAMPVEPGELKLQIKGQAKQGLTDQQEETISVEGLAAVQFELVDVNDPIEVNGQTTYEIRVTNSGSKAATNLRLVALLPTEMKAITAEGPSRHVVDGQRVLFDPVRTLAPKADTTYTVKVQGLQPGDLRIRVQLLTDEIRNPITKEESTRVYTDE